MIRKVIALSLLIAGCVNINPDLRLPRGSKVEVMDTTKEGATAASYLANIDHKRIQQDIVKATEAELGRLKIETATGSPDAAKLKYRINYIKLNGGELEVGYYVVLETKDGRIIFDDMDEKQDHTFEGIIAKIGKRVASYTEKSFQPPVTVAVQAEKQKFNTEATPIR